jgi:hypothetical protein
MSISESCPPALRGNPFQTSPSTGPERRMKSSSGYLPGAEGRRIFPYLTVVENLDMGAFLRNDKEEIRQDLDYIFDLFPILAERRNQPGAPSAAANSRCWPSPAPSWPGPACCCWMNPPWDWPLWWSNVFLKSFGKSMRKTHHHLPGGAKCQPGLEGRSPGLCDGNRTGDDDRQCREPAQ